MRCCNSREDSRCGSENSWGESVCPHKADLLLICFPAGFELPCCWRCTHDVRRDQMTQILWVKLLVAKSSLKDSSGYSPPSSASRLQLSWTSLFTQSALTLKAELKLSVDLIREQPDTNTQRRTKVSPERWSFRSEETHRSCYKVELEAGVLHHDSLFAGLRYVGADVPVLWCCVCCYKPHNRIKMMKDRLVRNQSEWCLKQYLYISDPKTRNIACPQRVNIPLMSWCSSKPFHKQLKAYSSIIFIPSVGLLDLTVMLCFWYCALL